MKDVVSGFPKPQKDFYKVYVRSCTYNQDSYILDCLKGVVAQDTDFPFIHHIIDDCSTDRTKEVILEHLNQECDLSVAEYYDNDLCYIIVADYKNNNNCTLVVYFLKNNLYKEPKKKNGIYEQWRNVCPYEAICEGDDYWTDCLKLRRQVAFLEGNTDYSVVAENGLVINSLNNKRYLFSEENSREWSIKEMIFKRRFPTAGVMFRTECIVGFIDECRYAFDSMMWCYLRSKGKLWYDKTVSSVYRRGYGITETTDKVSWAKLVELWYLEFQRLYCPEYISKSEISLCILRDYDIAIYSNTTSFLSKNMLYCLKKVFYYGGFPVLFERIRKRVKMDLSRLFNFIFRKRMKVE